MSKIGIGVTFFNRPEFVKRWNSILVGRGISCYAAVDSFENRMGVAYRKNECLKALKDCDYIFLFDEDCYPVKDGWINFFIDKMKHSDHLLFLNKYHGKIKCDNGICSYNDCGGVFMSLTKKAIRKVGAFNEDFTPWGFEHAEYSTRVHMAGLNPLGKYLCADGTEDYLYSEDYSNPNHKSSIDDAEKKKYFDINFPKFKEEIKNIYMPL